jgi:hypothetical protein
VPRRSNAHALLVRTDPQINAALPSSPQIEGVEKELVDQLQAAEV